MFVVYSRSYIVAKYIMLNSGKKSLRLITSLSSSSTPDISSKKAIIMCSILVCNRQPLFCKSLKFLKTVKLMPFDFKKLDLHRQNSQNPVTLAIRSILAFCNR